MIWTEIIQHTRVWLVEYAWRSLGAVAILFFGLALAAGINGLLKITLLKRLPPSRNLFFIVQIVWLGVVFATLSLVLAALGVAGPVIGFIVTVGLALGVIADSFGGLQLLGRRSFRVGDVIEIKGEGVIGEVQEISVTGTILRIEDHAEVIVPNRKLLDHLVVNYSPRMAGKVLSCQFVLDPSAGISVLEEHIRTSVRSVAGIESRYGEEVWVTLIEPNSITFNVKVSAPPFLAQQITSEFLKVAKTQFDNAGVEIRSLGPIAK